MNKSDPPPFLKWAGGKRWLVDRHPELLRTPFRRFIEPFVGSGAVFFALRPNSSVLCDKNAQLIETYQAIKDDWQKVAKCLREHHHNHSHAYYYKIRSQKLKTAHTRAAQFIYLNRTCWNGLYRVNLNGEFNVPVGTKQNAILPSDDFERIAQCLANAKLISGDFELALAMAAKQDFVFVDPPYTVTHNRNGFIKYNEHLFSWEDQMRLRDSVAAAVDRGAKVLVTNAMHHSVLKLYKGIGSHVALTRSSVIAGSARARGVYEEVAIKCF